MIPFQKQFILPEANIAETKELWEIVLEVPGIDAKQTKISIQDGKINLKGKINFSNFSVLSAFENKDLFYTRSFALPKNIDHLSVKAKVYRDRLMIRFPKKVQKLIHTVVGQKAYFSLQGVENLVV